MLGKVVWGWDGKNAPGEKEAEGPEAKTLDDKQLLRERLKHLIQIRQVLSNISVALQDFSY